MEFGPEIKVDGKRPEWLKDGDVWQWRIALDPHFKDGIAPSEYEQARTFGLIEAIRLPANDPRYNPTPTPDERAVAPELVARLVALAHSVATSPECTIAQTVEAQNILAALEPVDHDEVEVLALYEGWSSNCDEDVRSLVARTLARGRQLEKEGK